MSEKHIYAKLAEALVGYGVTHLFGMRLYPELDPSKILPVPAHHESSAALMAYSYARVSGKPGVMTLHRAATSNVMTGLAEAWQSSVPVIVLNDGVPRENEGRNALYAQDQIALFKPVSKWIADVNDPEDAPEMLAKAFQVATTGRPGPVIVNLRGAATTPSPSQMVSNPAVFDPNFSSYPANRIAPNPDSISKAASILMSAKRPCIVSGGGVILSRAWDELLELAEIGQFPVATTISGKGGFPERHKLSLGPTGSVVGGNLGRARIADKIVKDSDVVLLIGSRTNEMATSGWQVPNPSSTIIHIDVDTQEIGRNYQTELGVIGDAKLSIKAISEALIGAAFEPSSNRTGEIESELKNWDADNSKTMNSDEVPIHPARIMREIQPFIDSGSILVSDASNPFMWATSHSFVDAGPNFITPRGTGAIGSGLSLAIGAKLAAPDHHVICFEGDGGLLCGNLPELELAARLNIPIVVVVFNNGSYLLEKERMQNSPVVDFNNFLNLNYGEIARALGCDGIRVEEPSMLEPSIKKALASGVPTVIDVVCEPDVVFPSR